MVTDPNRFLLELDPKDVLIHVVSDDAPTLKKLTEALAGHGYRVHKFDAGEACVQSVQRKAPDLIVLDADLKGGAAFETCAKVTMAADHKYVPIILVASLAEAGVVAVGMDAGATEFLAKPVNVLDLYARVNSCLRTQRMALELESAGSILKTLATSVEAKDGTTGDHCERLAKNAVTFGRELGCSRDELRALRNGGHLHDIGKIAIPDAILNKPGKLDDAEWKIMKTHSTVGEAICRPLATMSEVLPIIRHHHERYNGTGYPDGLAGVAIPKLARAFLFTDVFDALTSPRPYKKAMELEAAVKLMEEEAAKGWSDPEMGRVFFRLARLGRIETVPAPSKA